VLSGWRVRVFWWFWIFIFDLVLILLIVIFLIFIIFLIIFFNFFPYHFISFNFLILYDPHSFYCYLFSIYSLIIFFYLVFISNLVLIALISICIFLLLFWVIRNFSSWFFCIFLLCDNLSLITQVTGFEN